MRAWYYWRESSLLEAYQVSVVTRVIFVSPQIAGIPMVVCNGSLDNLNRMLSVYRFGDHAVVIWGPYTN